MSGCELILEGRSLGLSTIEDCAVSTKRTMIGETTPLYQVRYREPPSSLKITKKRAWSVSPDGPFGLSKGDDWRDVGIVIC